MTTRIRLALGLLCVLSSPAARAADPVNRCVECHAAQPMVVSLGHTFDDWRSSRHAMRGVGCEKCHGGDPNAAEADIAHRGILPSIDRGSRIHATNLQATCGACHEKERAAFDKTSHAKGLRENGEGATCLTCHDPMANSLPSYATLDARCASCHDKPLRAKNALAMLVATKKKLRTTQTALEAARSARRQWAGGALQRLKELEGTYRDLQLEWHTFDTTKLFEDTRDVLALADLLEQEVRRHGQLEARKAADGTAPPEPDGREKPAP